MQQLQQEKYKGSASKGAFKQVDIGASAALRQMQNQVNPVLNAHKRNAEAVYAVQNRHLSTKQRAQSITRDSKKKVHEYDLQKLDNVRKWNAHAGQTLGQYASEGYNEIMGQAIEMSAFSKWSQTLVDVGITLAKLGVGQYQKNQAAAQTSSANSSTINSWQHQDSTIEARIAANTGQNPGQIHAALPPVTESNIDPTQSLTSIIRNDQLNALKTPNPGNPSGQLVPNNVASQNSLVVNNTSLPHALEKNQILTKQSIHGIRDKYNEYYKNLKLSQQGLKLDADFYMTEAEIIKQAGYMVANEFDILDDATDAGRFVQQKLIDDVTRKLRLNSDAQFKAVQGALIKHTDDVTKTAKDSAEPLKALWNNVLVATSKGSHVVNPDTQTGYNYNGGQADFIDRQVKTLIADGQHELAEQYLTTDGVATNLGGKPAGGSLLDQHPKLQEMWSNYKNRDETIKSNLNRLEDERLGRIEVDNLKLSGEAKPGTPEYEGSLAQAVDISKNTPGGKRQLIKWFDERILNAPASAKDDIEYLAFLNTSDTKYLNDAKYSEYLSRSGQYERLIKENELLSGEEKREHAENYLSFGREVRGTDFNYNEQRGTMASAAAKLLGQESVYNAGKKVNTLREKVNEGMALYKRRVLENYNDGDGMEIGEAVRRAWTDTMDELNEGKGIFRVTSASAKTNNVAEFADVRIQEGRGNLNPNLVAKNLLKYYNPNPTTGQYTEPLDFIRNPGQYGQTAPITNIDDTKAQVESYRQGHVTLTRDQSIIFNELNRYLDEPVTAQEFWEALAQGQGFDISGGQPDQIEFTVSPTVKGLAGVGYKKLAKWVNVNPSNVARGKLEALTAALWPNQPKGSRQIVSPVLLKRQQLREQWRLNPRFNNEDLSEDQQDILSFLPGINNLIKPHETQIAAIDRGREVHIPREEWRNVAESDDVTLVSFTDLDYPQFGFSARSYA